jgi:hypothetical protein
MCKEQQQSQIQDFYIFMVWLMLLQVFKPAGLTVYIFLLFLFISFAHLAFQIKFCTYEVQCRIRAQPRCPVVRRSVPLLLLVTGCKWQTDYRLDRSITSSSLGPSILSGMKCRVYEYTPVALNKSYWNSIERLLANKPKSDCPHSKKSSQVNLLINSDSF